MPEGLSYKFVAAAVMLGLIVVIVVIKGIVQIIGMGARALRDRLRSDRRKPAAKSAPAARIAPAADNAPVAKVEGGVAGFGRRRTALAAPDPAAPVSDFSHPVLGDMTSAEILSAVAEAGLPPALPEGPLPEGIDAARRHPIVFHTLPPQGPGSDGLSFFGGQPIGPESFQWPRRHGSEGQPLTFMMQWDCARLAAQDATGLLPTDGALYCFIDLEWGAGEPGARIAAFLHHPGPTEGWAEIPLPADAPPIFGDVGAMQVSGCTDKVDHALDYVPRVMPRFPFEPFALDHSAPADALPEGERLFWGDVVVKEQLLAIAQQGAPAEPIGEDRPPHRPFARPFPAYPHDFAAVRHLAAKMIDDLRWSVKDSLKRHQPDMSDEDCNAQVAVWMDEAKELFLLGCQRAMADPLDQAVADDIWQWLEARQTHHIGLRVGMHGHAVEAVRLSLGIGSRALDRVPQTFIDEAMRAYGLAFVSMETEHHDPLKHGTWQEYVSLRDAGELPTVRYVRARTPARLLGPPSFVQGDVEELMDEYVLLLELPSNSTPGLAIGDGVLQYLIRPEDLAARRFDRVVSMASSY